MYETTLTNVCIAGTVHTKTRVSVKTVVRVHACIAIALIPMLVTCTATRVCCLSYG